MIRIIDQRSSGKTEELIKIANTNNGIVICTNPQHFLTKARMLGYSNATFMSYDDFIKNYHTLENEIYIDELESFMSYFIKYYTLVNFGGYTQSKE